MERLKKVIKQSQNLSLFFGLLSVTLLPAGGLAGTRITFLGHATTLIQSSRTTVLTDPFFREGILGFVKRRVAVAVPVKDLPPVDVVLVTHFHPDHYDKGAIRALSPKPVLVVPWKRGRSWRKKGYTVVDLRPWESREVRGVRITAVPARHNSWHSVGYVLETDGSKIYFTGDTKLHKGLERIGAMGIDVMMMPYGGTPVTGNIWTASQAARAVARVRPGKVLPIHWDTMRNWLTRRPPPPPDRFLSLVAKESPGTEGVVLKTGEVLDLDGGGTTEKDIERGPKPVGGFR